MVYCYTYIFIHNLKDTLIEQSLKLIIDTSVCLNEIDTNWNISWPLTTRGEVAIQKCPGGAESIGMYLK